MKKQVILNSEGKPIVLNRYEQARADALQRIYNSDYQNALGYELNITTLTTIIKKVSEQKFYQIPFADYVPVKVGEGAFGSVLTKYRSFALGDDFETGNINTGANNSRLETAGAGIDSISTNIINWGKSTSYSLFDLQQAAKSGSWDIVSSLEKSRKRNWDLGLQKLAFLGSSSNTSILGLLNLSGVTNDTATLPQAIHLLTPQDLSTFAAKAIEAYRSNAARTAMPTHFVMPESDFNQLAIPSSPDFPVRSMLSILEESFQLITMNKGFKILPCAYGDSTNNSTGANAISAQRYAMYNMDEDSLAMNIPVDYTSTLANSLDNFMFQNAAYGQYTGVALYRPLEVLYFSHTTP